MPPKLSFLDMPAPAGYVPGLGRGATGFSTRADLGSAHRATDTDIPDDPERFRDPDDAGILGRESADADDELADEIYAQIDARMEERNKKRREIREEKERLEEEKQATIGGMFADAKRALSEVSRDEWLNLPESGDQTRKNKRARMEAREGLRSYNMSDTVLEGLRGRAEIGSHVTETDDGSVTHIKAISDARDKILDLKLSGRGDTASSIDPSGYITSLNSENSQSTTELADIKKMTPFVESLIRSNPRNAAGWIAGVRLAELKKKPSQAIQLAAQGCENCPTNEDVWLESIRVNDVVNARIIAAQAVKRLPESVRIWEAAADLETAEEAKKRVLRKALTSVPQSVQLWKQLVNLEDEEHARLLLRQAVVSVPLSVDLWLALARLEDHKAAEKVLNRARKAVRTAPEIWIAAARLREQVNGAQKEVDKIMKKGVSELEDHGRVLSREEWLEHAHLCEKEAAPLACGAIVRATVAQGMDKEPEHVQIDTFLDCSRDLSFPVTNRAVLELATEMFPFSEKIWLTWTALEKRLNSGDQLWSVLEKAVTSCKKSTQLWLTYIREKWHRGKFKESREIVSRAFEEVGHSQEIWLEAVQLELEIGQPERARNLLEKSRDEGIAREKLWVRAVRLERELGAAAAAVSLAEKGLEEFVECDGLWIELGKAKAESADASAARDTYLQGTKNCPKSVPLWILLASAEEARGVQIRARSVLEQAALINPNNEELWLARVRLELRAGNLAQVKVLLSRALQECPHSGRLIVESIGLEPRSHRKSKLVEAVSKNENDGYILVLLAKSLWLRNQYDKASKWLTTALEADSNNGDVWLWAYKFFSEREEGVQEVIEGFQQAEPTEGEVWKGLKEDIGNFGKTDLDLLKEGSQKLDLGSK
ncbi:Pre-mRNA-splicing factor prp1 [Yarrowia sp. C11]|nr:Pre-mRNA-splicing factor prp1 [Yarrowia sp. C11]